MSAGTRVPRPARIGLRSDELALAVALVGVASCLGAADIAGVILGGHLAVLGKTGRVLVTALRRPRAAVVLPGGHVVPGWSFLALTGLLLVGPLVAAAVGVGWVWRRRDHGSGFASPAEIRRVAGLGAARRQARQTRPSLLGAERLPEDLGYPLGVSVEPRGVRLVASWEHSLELVAPPGSGKTLRVLVPILRQHPGPVLATSTKPDLYEMSCVARKRIGPVVALDPERLCPAAEPLRWSPVAGCSDTQVAERRASALVAATGDGTDVRGGGFFRRSAATVLAAYLHAAAIDGASMRDVVGWAARPHDPAPLRVLARVGEGSIDWGARLLAHTSGASETTSGVMRTVDLALACFSDPAVLAACSPSEGEAFDFDAFFGYRGTVFALGKDRGALGGTGPLVTAFSEDLLVAAEQRAATMPSRRLDPPMLACLDEAPSIAPLPGLPALMADGRGRGIVTVIAMQSFSQAEERWGLSGARTIRNAASVLGVFGGLSVAGDLDELSRLCGTTGREHTSLSEDGSGRSNLTRHLVDEPVLTPAQIHSLPNGTALLFWGRLPPVLSHLPGTWEGKGAKQIAAEERAARLANDEARGKPDPGDLPGERDIESRTKEEM